MLEKILDWWKFIFRCILHSTLHSLCSQKPNSFSQSLIIYITSSAFLEKFCKRTQKWIKIVQWNAKVLQVNEKTMKYNFVLQSCIFSSCPHWGSVWWTSHWHFWAVYSFETVHALNLIISRLHSISWISDVIKQK